MVGISWTARTAEGLDARLPGTRLNASTGTRQQRGVLVRRALVLSDLVGLSIAFITSTAIFANPSTVGDHVPRALETVLFLATLPLWLVFAGIFSLYDHDAARADHSTADETLGVISLVTLGTWFVFVGCVGHEAGAA